MRKVSENPLAGTQVWHDYDEQAQEHQFVTHYSKDTIKAVLDQNARLAGHGMGKEMRLAGSIPFYVIEMWKKDYGVDIYSDDPEQRKKARALYNSSEFHKVRINDFKI